MAENRVNEMNGGDDEEEALRIAIAMSLGQDPLQKDPAGDAPVVDLTEADAVADTDLPSMDRAVALAGNEATDNDVSSQPASVIAPANAPATLGIDRKKMEQERLARLKKRKAHEPADAEPPRPRQRAKVEPATTRGLQASPESYASRQSHTPSAALPFPKGVVKKTWCRECPRMGDDITIEEVLQKDHLELAVLSSFQWDDDWLLSKVNLAKTKLVLIAFAADDIQKEDMRRNVPRDKIRFCFPPMNGPGSMHSKLQLLKYPSYLRIVIPTGNLVSYDWGETGSMENMVFIIDIPRVDAGTSSSPTKLTSFGEELCYFLRAQTMDENLIRSLQNYDFSETASYGFVHSIAGSHGDEEWRRTGYCGLGRAVTALGLDSVQLIDVDYVSASLGSANFDLLQMLYNACQGDTGLKEYASRTTRSKKTNDDASAAQHALLQRHMRVFFPSRKTVEASRGGRNSAGTICFLARWWNQPSFPRDVLRDCKSKRRGILMHSKIIYVRRRDSGDHHTQTGFAYVGSANFTESAWGRLVKDRATGKPKITCRNWECGVVMAANGPPSASTVGETHAGGSHDEYGLFDGRLPVPMQVPGIPYIHPHNSSGTDLPWFHHDG